MKPKTVDEFNTLLKEQVARKNGVAIRNWIETLEIFIEQLKQIEDSGVSHPRHIPSIDMDDLAPNDLETALKLAKTALESID